MAVPPIAVTPPSPHPCNGEATSKAIPNTAWHAHKSSIILEGSAVKMKHLCPVISCDDNMADHTNILHNLAIPKICQTSKAS
ncbi:hypothetical protein E2C01_008322 [Portunus trituberculatus]|uniref:Uncharacterized protein n=1 Tax=Portunus trituberculatus TaxID=210409 RepID=A0A5B7D1G9_PORTR|nr:hypothetical protein [Portunus trituberculatus]